MPTPQLLPIYEAGSVSVSLWVMSNSLWPVDCSPLGSSVPGILQARILEWIAIPFFRGCPRPRDRTWVSSIAGRFFTVWTTGGCGGSQFRKPKSILPTTVCPKWNSRKSIDMRSESKVWAFHHCSTLTRRRKLRPKRWSRSHVTKGLLECGGSLDFIMRVIGSHTRFQPGEETSPSAITLYQTPMVKTLC